VLNLGYPSFAWSSYFNKYIAVGMEVWDCSNFVFALSDDLITWSEPYVIRQANCTRDVSYREIYPSLIDPASPSNNFDTAGQHPYLYFTTFHPNEVSPTGRDTVVRGISRQPIELF
jgi:hypothetical protein